MDDATKSQLPTNKITNSMELDSFLRSQQSLSQEIPCLSWNPQVHFHVHKSLPILRPCVTFDRERDILTVFKTMHMTQFT
jgi:hypothetical protein